MTNVPETQSGAYKELKDSGRLGPNQQRVYEEICKEPAAMYQLSMRLGWPINSITGRVRELVQLKKIEDSGEIKVNPDTNRPAIVWQKWTGDKDQLPLFTEPK